MTHDDDMTLELTAIAYMHGELDSAATEAFEAQLAEDQAAREALELAVLATEATAGAVMTTHPVVAGSIGFWISAAAAAVVAAMGVGLIWTGQPATTAQKSTPTQPAHIATTHGSNESADLIAGWIELADTSSDESDFEELATLGENELETLDWLSEAVESREN